MIQSHENCLLLRMSFLKKQPFFPNTTLQGENLSEDHFWEISLPILGSPLSQHSIEPIVPLEKSNIRGEDGSLLANHQLNELCVYP